MAFSDFPPPKEFPNFLHNSQVLEYYKMYMEKFGLDKYITYNTKVTKLNQSSNFDKTGCWDVQTICQGTERSETYDAVLVCTGHFAEQHNPHFEGEESFTGKVMHSLDYRTPTGFKGKNVLVIGIGNSGVDIGVELSRITKQVSGRIYWIVKDIMLN